VSCARETSSSKLGFDPTIECIPPEDKNATNRNYTVKIHDNKDEPQESIDRKRANVYTFATKRCISSYRAASIRSRGTCIFEGIDSNNTPFVIKDVWIDHDREVEGNVLEKVRKYLEKESPGDLQLFLDPICHGCVLIDGVKDLTLPLLQSTEKMDLGGQAASQPGSSDAKRKGTNENRSVGSVPDLRTGEPAVIGLQGGRRKRYRIAFKGRPARALHDLKSERDVFLSLLGGVKGASLKP